MPRALGSRAVMPAGALRAYLKIYIPYARFGLTALFGIAPESTTTVDHLLPESTIFSVTPPHAPALGLSDRALVSAARATDALAMVGTSVSANIVYATAFGGVADPLRYAALGALFAAVLVPLCHIQEHYSLESLFEPGPSIRRFLPLWLIVLLFFIFILFAAKVSSDFSRATVGFIALSAPGLVYLGRLTLAAFARRALENGTLRKRRVFFLHLVGSRPPPTRCVDVVGSGILSFNRVALRETVRAIRGSPAEEVILSMDWADERKTHAILAELRSIPLPVKLLANDVVAELLKNPLSRVGETVGVEVQRGPLTPIERGLKRALDLAVSALALIALCPLFAAIAVVIKLDSSGPVIFR
ncbi:MAG TPA: hypothetical protein VKB96_11625, partial [Gammaproteobacteria bacterium]|nr:hypothetical protein [Gammaproteobacteria bacterium]